MYAKNTKQIYDKNYVFYTIFTQENKKNIVKFILFPANATKPSFCVGQFLLDPQAL
jgi:hypothetical protein